MQLNIEEIFQTADYNKTNALDLVQARNAVKMFLPSITDQEMRYVMAHLYYQVSVKNAGGGMCLCLCLGGGGGGGGGGVYSILHPDAHTMASS